MSVSGNYARRAMVSPQLCHAVTRGVGQFASGGGDAPLYVSRSTMVLAHQVHRGLKTMSAVSSQVVVSNRVSAQIAENTLSLVREELDVRCARMRRLGIGAATAMGLTWIAMSLTQIALLVLAMSPLFAATFQAHTVAACALPVTFLAILAWTMTVRSWGLLLDEKQRPSGIGSASATSFQCGAAQKN